VLKLLSSFFCYYQSMHDFKTIAHNLARQAGELMRTNFSRGMTKEWKEDDTPLTVTDTAINELVIQTIAKEFPAHSVLGEEQSNIIEGAEYTWVLDPIDGTVPFSHGFPVFAFSLALTFGGEVILGVIYDPMMDRLLYAEKGGGAFLNGNPVRVSSRDTLRQTIVEIQSWKDYSPNLNPLKNEIIQMGGQASTMCSVVYAGMLVALGELGGVLFSGTKPWDAAAVKVIVEAAGGKVTDLAGNDQRYDQTVNGLIVSNGVLHEQLEVLVKRAPRS
jgi:myo-inositol-1(or 4)-monophosphatase